MKTFLTTLSFLLLGLFASAQSKFSFGIEYFPSVTNVTHEVGNPYSTGLWPVSNYFLRAGYSLSPKFELTSGLGLLTAREFNYFDANGQLDIETIKSHRFQKYLVVPIGIKYQFGSFFINPDIGIGWNVSNQVKNEFVYTDGRVVSNKYEDKYSRIDKMTYPVSFGFGNSIQLKSCFVTMGVRGYYNLNQLTTLLGSYPGHYYGFGVFCGVSF
jgi:hypothetical protein